MKLNAKTNMCFGTKSLLVWIWQPKNGITVINGERHQVWPKKRGCDGGRAETKQAWNKSVCQYTRTESHLCFNFLPMEARTISRLKHEFQWVTDWELGGFGLLTFITSSRCLSLCSLLLSFALLHSHTCTDAGAPLHKRHNIHGRPHAHTSSQTRCNGSNEAAWLIPLQCLLQKSAYYGLSRRWVSLCHGYYGDQSLQRFP